ncbi:hypothetical protein MPH_08166 [Macrophomina phaseolina MS6]|uniref:Uncharacterized protein n=1 Tax=Macrophomina phaseolina (strain MS6) TaxID=1126212 RepID=K2RJ71_MACPH|nr:hypothetical protein MPH_08166 [Macrophomina phaseolina MS6]
MAPSPLLAHLLNSNWRAYERHVTEVKIKQSIVTCCLCSTASCLEADERRSLKSVICSNCSHASCADCVIKSEVFTKLDRLRHHVKPQDRLRYSFGFYCDRCGASNKVIPQLQHKDEPLSASNSSQKLRPRTYANEYYVDFTWRKCRWCDQRCHLKCLLYRIKPWEQPEAPPTSVKRARREYDAHTRNIKARLAKGTPSSPLALFALTPPELPLETVSSSSSHILSDSLTLEELDTLEYGL